eukprot:1350110-Amphidinium_carterae.1
MTFCHIPSFLVQDRDDQHMFLSAAQFHFLLCSFCVVALPRKDECISLLMFASSTQESKGVKFARASVELCSRVYS